MTIYDLWKDLDKTEIAERRQNQRPRWQRRWQGPDADPKTGKLRQHKQSYAEHQKPQALLDDAKQAQQPHAQQHRRASITVGTLLSRHLGTKTDRAPKTIEADQYHGGVVSETFGDRLVTTLDYTEVATWSQRTGASQSSRKKQLEILRAAIKGGIRDIAKGHVTAALARALARANTGRTDKIKRLSAHGLRHTFAAIALSEAEANLMSVSRALGHARPSITLDHYGHLAPSGLETLMGRMDEFATPNEEPVAPP